MGLKLELKDFKSRLARINSTGADMKGIRRVAMSAISSRTVGADSEGKGGVIQWFWDVTKRFTGFLSKTISEAIGAACKITISFILGKVFSAIRYVWTFNWNQSDESLDASVEAAWNQLGGSLGGLVGNALGWAVCGVGGAFALAAFNEPMALYALENVGEEALEEISANFGNVIRQSTSLAGRAIFNNVYKGGRRFLDLLLDAQLTNLEESGQISNETVANVRKEREEERKKPWSFAGKWEETVESIPNQWVQNFVEELFEEFTESCVEAGYVVADSMDTYLTKQRNAEGSGLGQERTIEIEFDRSNDDE